MILEGKQSVELEAGIVTKLGALLDELKVERVFFIVDAGAYEHSGAREKLSSILKSFEVQKFSEFELNPKIEDVERGIELFRQWDPGAVVALGGGSALDMAKLIANCGFQEEAPLKYIEGVALMEERRPPLIVIPTTSGTGSEATHFAVVYVEGNKYSLGSELMLPDYVLLDPELTYRLPSSITAATGLDALSQAMESIWSVGATEESVSYASEALGIVWKNLKSVVDDPTPEGRVAMAYAAHLAGRAINISKTTAPHAISYGITTHYGVPHGSAVALTLGSFLEYNSELDEKTCNDPRGVVAARTRIGQILRLLRAETAGEGAQFIRTLVGSIGCPVRLRDVGITVDGLTKLVTGVNVERLSNNPRKMSQRSLHELLKTLL